jgi:hypothetical protein
MADRVSFLRLALPMVEEKYDEAWSIEHIRRAGPRDQLRQAGRPAKMKTLGRGAK